MAVSIKGNLHTGEGRGAVQGWRARTVTLLALSWPAKPTLSLTPRRCTENVNEDECHTAMVLELGFEPRPV